MCTSFYHQSGVETLLPLSNALRFHALKTKPTFNYDREFGAKTKYMRRKRTIGVRVLVVLASIRRRNFDTAIERAQVLLT